MAGIWAFTSQCMTPFLLLQAFLLHRKHEEGAVSFRSASSSSHFKVALHRPLKITKMPAGPKSLGTPGLTVIHLLHPDLQSVIGL